jgi:hypothetical protein
MNITLARKPFAKILGNLVAKDTTILLDTTNPDRPMMLASDQGGVVFRGRSLASTRHHVVIDFDDRPEMRIEWSPMSPGRSLIPAPVVKAIASKSTAETLHLDLDDRQAIRRAIYFTGRAEGLTVKAAWEAAKSKVPGPMLHVVSGYDPKNHIDAAWSLNVDAEGVADFPALPDGRDSAERTANASDLLGALKRVLPFTEKDAAHSGRYPALSGVRVEILTTGEIQLIGSDGRRIARQTIADYSTTAVDATQATTVPAQALKPIMEALKAAGRHALIGLAIGPDGSLTLRLGSDFLIAKPADGRYPMWRDCIEVSYAVVPLDTATFAAQVRAVAIGTSEGSAGITFDECDDRPNAFTLSAKSFDGGAVSATLHTGEPIRRADDPNYIGFTLNAGYLTDLLRIVRDGKDTATLEMGYSGPNRAVRFDTADGLTVVIMPMTRDEPVKVRARKPVAVATQEPAGPDALEGSGVFGADSADSPEPMEPKSPAPATPSGVSRYHPPAVEIIADIVPPEPTGESPKDACDRYRAEWKNAHPRAPKGPETQETTAMTLAEVEPTPEPDDSPAESPTTPAPKQTRMRKGVVSRDYWRNDGVTIYKLASGAFVRRAHRKDGQTDGKTYGAFAPVFGPDGNHIKLGATDTLSAALGLAERWEAPKDGTTPDDATTGTLAASDRILALPGPRPMLSLPKPAPVSVPAPCCSPDEPTPCAACLTSPMEGEIPDAVFESHPLPSRVFAKVPAPVSAALSLTIGDRAYGLAILPGPVYRLDYREKVYDVTPDGASLAGATCDCPDYIHRRAGLDSLGCRHIRALRECRLLAPVQNFPAPPKDGGGNDPDRAPDFSEPSTDAQAPVLSPILSLALMGFPICGGSPEADDPRLEVLGDTAQDEAEAGASRILAENGDDSTGWAECWIDEGDGPGSPDTAPIIGGTDGRDFRCRACLRLDDFPVHGDSDPDCAAPVCVKCGAVMVPEGAYAPDPLLYAILRADLPPVRNPDLRKERRTVWAKAIRRLLADLGIKGVSITTPHYSMAHSIDIKLPAGTPHDRGAADHEYRDCPMCQERNRAQDRITQIILAAFPDLDDRSDSMTDYFDFCLSVD